MPSSPKKPSAVPQRLLSGGPDAGFPQYRSPFLMYPESFHAERERERQLAAEALAFPTARMTVPQLGVPNRMPAHCKHRFIYSGAASSVSVIGDWLEWKTERAIPLLLSQTVWWADVNLPLGRKILYKFIVDGNWRPDPSLPTESDATGNTNNVMITPNTPGVKVDVKYRQHIKVPNVEDLNVTPVSADNMGSDTTVASPEMNGAPIPVTTGQFFDEKVLFLFHAAKQNFPNRIQSLIEEEGVEVNAASSSEPGVTALNHAVEAAQADSEVPDAVVVLLQLGADPSLKDPQGLTVKDHAARGTNGPLAWFLSHPLVEGLAKTNTNSDSITYRRRALLILAEFAKRRQFKAMPTENVDVVANRAALKRLVSYSAKIHHNLSSLSASLAGLATLKQETNLLAKDIEERIAHVRGLKDVDTQVEALNKAKEASVGDLEEVKEKIAARFSEGVEKSVRGLVDEVEKQLADVVALRIDELRDGVGTWQEREQSLQTIASKIDEFKIEVGKEHAQHEKLLKDVNEATTKWITDAAKAVKELQKRAKAAASYLEKRLTQIDEEIQMAEDGFIDTWKSDLLQEKAKTERNFKDAAEWGAELERDLLEIQKPERPGILRDGIAEAAAIQAKLQEAASPKQGRTRSWSRGSTRKSAIGSPQASKRHPGEDSPHPNGNPNGNVAPVHVSVFGV